MKKIFALLLVAALVMSIAPTVLAEGHDDYDTVKEAFTFEQFETLTVEWGETVSYDFTTESGKMSLDIEAWGGGRDSNDLYFTKEAGENYLKKSVFDEFYAFRVIKGAGSAYYDVKLNVQGTGTNRYIKGFTIEFKNELFSLKAVPYKFGIEIRQLKGSVKDRQIVTFEGEFQEKRREDVDGSWQEIDLDNHTRIVESDANISNFVIETGVDDIKINTRLYRGDSRAVYARVWNAVSDDEYIDIAAKHPQLVTIYRLNQINLANTHATLSIGANAATDYIYDADFTLIGRGKANLPISTVYYVATSEVDWGELGFIEVDDEPEDLDDLDDDLDDLDDFDIGGDTGGDSTPFNINDNPGTGC